MTFIPLTGASSGGSKPSNWTVRERLRNITKALTAGSSLDLRFAEKFFYQNDALYPAMELMATHSRTSSAWYPNWDFKSGSEVGRLVEYGADERRYGDYGALDEGASTNQIRNPRGEGAEAGTPGTLPTNWTLSMPGISGEVIGTGTENGWPYLDYKVAGTPTGDGFLFFEPSTQIAAASGEDWTESVGMKLVGGDLTNMDGIRVVMFERSGAGSNLAAQQSVETVVDSAHKRYFHTATLSNGSTSYVQPALEMKWVGSGAVDFTLRIYAPQLEQSATPTSPVLPTVGTPAAATRAADIVTGVDTGRTSRGWLDTEWDYSNGGKAGDLLEYLPGVPRVGPVGLVVEPNSTNQLRNPRGEGAVAGVLGSGGSLPTYWGESGSLEVIGAGIENGTPYTDVRFTGTNFPGVRFEDLSQVSAAQGEDWSLSVGLQIIAGNTSNISELQLRIRERGSGGYGSQTLGSLEASKLDAEHRRFFTTYTVADAGTTSVVPWLYIDDDGGAVDITLRIFAPQLEQRVRPTSVILPEIGSPAAATRAAERPSIDVSSILGAAHSLFVEFALLVPADGTSRYAIGLSTGATTNAIGLGVKSDDELGNYVGAGGVTQTSDKSGSPVDTGGLYRVAIGVAQDDVYTAYSLGSPSVDTSVDMPDFSSAAILYLGDINSAGEAAPVIIRRLSYTNYRLPDAALDALVA